MALQLVPQQIYVFVGNRGRSGDGIDAECVKQATDTLFDIVADAAYGINP